MPTRDRPELLLAFGRAVRTLRTARGISQELLAEGVGIHRTYIDEHELASAAVDIRFSFGTRSLPIFQEISTHLAAVRNEAPDAIDGVGHLIHYDADAAAAYIRSRSGGT